MKKVKINLLLIVLISVSLQAQSQVKFRKVLGSTDYDYGYSVQQTNDKGYVVGGASSSLGSGATDMLLVKTDSMGIPLLHRTFGGFNIDKGSCIKQTIDKGYIFLGYTNSFGSGGYDFYLVKTDSLYNTEWEKTYGGTDWDFGNSVAQTVDGGYILCGSTYSFGKGDQDYYLVKTDADGDTLWTKTYGGQNEDIAKSVIQTSDGGYILTGTTKSLGDINGDIYTIKTNSVGDTLWTNKFGGTLADYGNDILESNTGGYIVAGETSSFGTASSSGIVIRLSNSGSLLNNYAIAPNGNTGFNSFNAITEDINDRIAMAGSTSQGANSDIWFFILNNDWSFYSASTYGTFKNESGFSVGTTADICWIICGQTNGFNNGLEDIYLIKTDVNGYSGASGSESNLIISVEEHATINNEMFTIYPNPTSDNVTVAFANKMDISEIIITDILGNVIKHINTGTSNAISFSIENFKIGIYFVTLKNEKNISTQKLLVNH